MDAWIRPGAAVAAFVLFALLEILAPDRRRTRSRLARWSGAAGLVAISSVAGRLVLPAGLAGVAVWAKTQQLGFLHHVAWPGWADMLAGVLVLDLAVWAQHAATHKVPLLWRLHRVHHTDTDVDASTAFRFHPLEIVLSLGWKSAVIIALGAPPEAAFWFEVILNTSAQFNHANMKLPAWLDRALRPVLVTPDLHRVHHSVARAESDRNFGFCLSIWDRMFSTYKAGFDAGPGAPVGQSYWRDEIGPAALLTQPFRRPSSRDQSGDQGRPG